MTGDQYADLLTRLSEIEAKFTAALNTGMATLAALAESQHQAQLEQERRNSSFATLARLDDLTRQVQDQSTLLATRNERFDNIEKRQQEMQTQLAALAGRQTSFLSGALGYLVMLLLMLASNLLGFVLGHLGGPIHP